MSAPAAQFQFAAEFVTFLVAAAGLALAVLRTELLSEPGWGRAGLALGLLAMATGAFLHGSRLVTHADAPGLVALAGAAVVFLAAGSLRWRGEDLARRLPWAGVALEAVAPALVRARGEAARTADSFRPLLQDALVTSASVRGVQRDTQALAGDLQGLGQYLTTLQTTFLKQDALVWLSPTRQVLAIATSSTLPTLPSDRGLALALAGSPVVDEAILSRAQVGSVLSIGTHALAVAASPALAGTPPDLQGVALAVRPLDFTYLQTEAGDDPSLSLVLVARDGVLARLGAQPSQSVLSSPAR